MLGVYNLKLARLYYYLYQQTEVDFTIVTSLDGYDEISLTDNFKVLSNSEENIYTPEELGFVRAVESDLYGGQTVEDAAAIFDRVLSDTATLEQKNAVVANAAFAIRTIDRNMPIEEAIGRARESIESGNALKAFRKFVEINS